MKTPVHVEFQGIVPMTIRQTNDPTFMKIFLLLCFMKYIELSDEAETGSAEEQPFKESSGQR